ncbi:Hypothetical predicted protein, partial [Xyrichtys novacula]
YPSVGVGGGSGYSTLLPSATPPMIKAEVEDRGTVDRPDGFFHVDDTLFCGCRGDNTGEGYTA